MANEHERNKEIRILSLSLWLTIGFALVGVLIAIMCDSQTLMLDGLYGVADVIVSLLAIFVTKKINEPPNERYHFGYAKFEPLMTGVDGTLIMTICAGSIIASIQDIIHADPIKNVPVALWYSFVSIFICLGFGLYMQVNGRKLKSKILSVDSKLWIIEGFLSAVVFIAFGVSYAFPKTMLGKINTSYTDPVLCILISLFLLREPLLILRDSFLDLVDASPGKKLDAKIKDFAEASAKKYNLLGVDKMKIRQAGRKIFAYILFKADQNVNIRELNVIRDNMIRDMVSVDDRIELIVLF
ncbi:MAG: cation diffusion facilitator family transporter [Candidatus Omnitrophica bacterium]|nr:cation diffusion facilitator family transporter [Candidatus Omnitrophota bacterium]